MAANLHSHGLYLAGLGRSGAAPYLHAIIIRELAKCLYESGTGAAGAV